MDISLGSLGDFPLDDDKQNTAAQAGSHIPSHDKHLLALKRIQKRLTLGSLSRGIIPRRTIPPEVLVQLDKLLDQAIQSMVEGKEPAILSPMMWDAILILSRTGIRCSELTHLEAPSQADQQGCLEQDSSGSWWLLIKAKGTKANKDYRIPIHTDSGVVEAVHRQYLRISDIPDIFGKHYLFRDDKGLLSSTTIRIALRKLAVHLTYEGQPYVIATHQFRHTIAQQMSALSKMMGHASSSACQYYVHSRQELLLKDLDQLREELQRGEEQADQEGDQQIEEQEGQEE
jgi:integrase